MPHEVRGLVLTIINDADDLNKACDDWQLVLSWCLLAAQQDANGNSYLGVPVDAVTEGDDDYFEKCIDQRLDAVFGPRPNTGSVGTTGPWGSTHPQTAPSQVSALMATEVGKEWATSNGICPNLGGVMTPKPRVIPKMTSRL